MMHGWCPKPGSLKFGIDNILQNEEFRPQHQKQQPGKTSRKITNSMTFSQSGFGPYSLPLQTPNSTIDHFYGHAGSQAPHPQKFHPLSSGFSWNNLAAFSYNSGPVDQRYLPRNDYRQDLPSIVQRVPLAISYRKSEQPTDLPKTYNAANAPARPGKRKKSWTRAVFSSLQRKGLERSFFAQQYISKKDRRKLAATLGLSDSQVRIWYANRRMKNKKTTKNEASS